MAVARILSGAAKQAPKVGGKFKDMLIQAIPEALTGGAMTTGLGVIMGQPLDEALTYGAADAVGSALTLGALGKANVTSPFIRNAANIVTGLGTGKLISETVYKDRYAQQALQGQGGQAVTNAQQQAQRGNVNGMTMDDLAGKYMEDTMFQQLQGAMQGGQEQGDLVRMMNSMGPTYDMNNARANMASIMGM